MTDVRSKTIHNLASVSLPIILAVLSAALFINSSLARFEEQIKQQGKTVEALAASVTRHIEDPEIHHAGIRALVAGLESQGRRIERLEDQVEHLRDKQ